MKLGLAIAVVLYVLGVLALSIYRMIRKNLEDKKRFQKLFKEGEK